MKNSPMLIILATCLLMACGDNGSWPDPYGGFKHSSEEHGYWSELSIGSDTIKELHFHTKGYSVTYDPFEYRKDYWGMYERSTPKLKLILESGNDVPADFDGIGEMYIDDHGDLNIEGINLDGRRPRKTSFKFKRFHPERQKPNKTLHTTASSYAAGFVCCSRI